MVTDDPLIATCSACGAQVVLPETIHHKDEYTCPECGVTGRVLALIVVPLEMPECYGALVQRPKPC